jgi:NAD(P)-dependent dehydrogenase (short-subunit alcohol dehydrogenase family)
MARATYPLEGKTVLITGAARGIGADAARRAAKRGARVSLVGLEPEELQRVAADCGEGTLWFEADVTDRDALDRAVSTTAGRTGGIDVVVANAGIAAGGPARYMPDETFARVIEVNLVGAWRTITACLPHLIESRGYVLPVASLAAVIPQFPGFAPYSASKAGIEAAAKALRIEVAHLGVDVGVAYFGWIDTDLVRGSDERPAFSFLRSRLRGPLAKTAPVSAAGEAIVNGIERRARRVGPGWITRAAIPLRGMLDGPVEREMQKHAPEAMALFEAELQATGDAMTRPVGAGGAAAESASTRRSEVSDRATS